MEQPEQAGGESITVCLRNPARHSDFCLKVSPSSSLHDLKLAIQRAYDGNPAPEAQTLIYGGKVLKDANLRLTDILPQPLATDAPHNLHLVVRPPSPGAEVRPTSSGSSSASSSGGGHGAGSAAGGGASARGVPSMPATPALSRATSGAPRQGPGSSAGPAAAPAAAPALHVPLTAGALPGISAVYGATTTHTSLPGAWPALAASSAGLAPGAVPPCFTLNPVAAAAYQAAYAAALGVAQSMTQAPPGGTVPLPQQQHHHHHHQQQQPVSQQAGTAGAEEGAGPFAAAGAVPAAGGSAGPSSTPGSVPAAAAGAALGAGTLPQYVPPPFPGAAYALYYPQTYALAQQVMQQQIAMQQQRAGDAGAAGQPQHGVPLQVLPPGVPLVGMMPVGGLAAHPGAAVQGAWPAAMRYRLRAVRHGLGGAAAPAGPAGAAQQLGAQPHAGARRRRARVVTLQISVRTLLQLVVFGVLLYQHCSWQRLLALGAGAAALWAFNSWAPLRQFIASLLVPPPPPAAAAPPHAPPHFGAAPQDPQQQQQQPAAPAAQQQQPQQQQQPPSPPEQPQGPPAPAQPQAAPPGNSPLRPQGLVREVVTVLVGLVMSLVPGFGQNAEDAAVFQAAQEMVAREAAAAERRRRRAGDEAAAAEGRAE